MGNVTERKAPIPMVGRKVYLGDGAYADLNDADQLVLTTEDGISTTNTIYLEPEVWSALCDYMKTAYVLNGSRSA